MQPRSKLVVALVVATALAVVPTSAVAAPLVDEAPADFAAAPHSDTTWAERGPVTLRPADLSTGFDALPGGWTATLWGATGGATFASGAVTLDGARVHDDLGFFASPRVLEFRARFSGDAFQHVGFGDTFGAPPWAMFSTAGGSTTAVFARSRAVGFADDSDAIAVTPTDWHVYRIEWSPTDVSYYVDGLLRVTHDAAIASDMRPVASDLNAGGGTVEVDWLGVGEPLSSGTFVSRVHDAGDARAVWGSLSASTSGTVGFETRSGKSATPDGTWSAWQPTVAGEIASPVGRYIEYRATLDGASSSLTRVEMGYEIDDVAPAATISGLGVNGTTATVSFSSTADDLDRFECSIDGAAFATCTTPKAFSGLGQGAHTVRVRAVDAAGNAGTTVQRAFAIDTVAPAVTIDRVDVSGSAATVRFSSGASDVARFECRRGSAAFATCTSPKAFTGLASGQHSVSVRAVDRTGNVGATVTRSFTVPMPPPPEAEPEVDETAPAVEILTRTLRASRKGIVTLRVACPDDETRCRLAVRLKDGRKLAGRKNGSVLGGKRGQVKVQLKKAVRTRLAALGKLKLTVLVTATDDAGNARTTRRKLTVRPVAP